MNKLSAEGFKCKIDNEEINIKVYTCACCVDSVARAPMQGFILFNGSNGCPWCLHPGKWVWNYAKKNFGSHKYPLSDKEIKFRNVKNTLKHMYKGTPLNPCFGLKGLTPLINLNGFNIIEGFVPDPVHILSGIGKQFAKIWFGEKNKFSELILKK